MSKYLVSFLTLTLVALFSPAFAMAAEESHHESAPNAEAHTADQDKNQAHTQNKPEGHAEHTGSAEHDGKSYRNLFPTKVADTSKGVRPMTPTIQEPGFMATVPAGGNVTLKWTAVEGVDAYHLQVASDVNFKWLLQNEQLYHGTSYELKGLEAGKSYYWRVAGFKSDNVPGESKGPFVKSVFETK